MSRLARNAGGGLLRWAITLGALVAAGLLAWTGVRHSITHPGQATGRVPEVAAYAFAGLALITAAQSARRVRMDLAGHRSEHGTATSVMSASLRPGAIVGLVVRGATKGSMDIVDLLAPALTLIFAIAATGWAYSAAPDVEYWPEPTVEITAVTLGIVAGFTIAARVGAIVGRRRITPRDFSLGSIPGAGIGAFLSAVAMVQVLERWGSLEHARSTIITAAISGFVAVGLGTSASLAGRQIARKRLLAGPVAAALSIPDAALSEDGPTRWKVKRGGQVHVRPGGGAGVARAAGDLDAVEARVAQVMPEYTVDRDASGPDVGITLVPASEEVKARRALLAETERQVTDIKPAGDGTEVWHLSSEVSPAHGERIDAVARRRGMTLISWRPYDREAVVGALSEAAMLVRGRVADLLRCEPWDMTVDVQGVPDRDVDQVTIKGAPWPAGDAREKTVKELIQRLPGGNPGWAITDDPADDRVHLAWRKRPELPPMVDLSDLMPAAEDPGEWHRLPLGVGADGAQVGLDLTAGPHAIIAGPTGSGKTVALLTLVAGALARGHHLVMIDPTKSGLDFAAIRPWCTAWADDYPTARAAMERVYAEVGRRKEILKREQQVKWSDLDAEVREAEDIQPLTVLIDEYGSLALEASVPKGLEKDDPLVQESSALNAQKAVIKELVGRIAREARFVGIHLQIALQRPDVAVMGSGELRSNLTSAVQLAPPGRGVSPDALRMLFHAEVVDAAEEQIAVLDDGTSRGLAVVAAEGGSARGLRVGYAPMREIPAMLRAAGVPGVARPWDLAEQVEEATAASGPREGEVLSRTTDTSPAEVDLGEMEIDLDDLEEVPTTPEPGNDDGGEEEFDFEPAKPAKPAASSLDDWDF